MRLRQAFLWSMIGSLCLDAVLGIAALLLPSRGPVGELLGSAALVAGFSLAALLCAIVLERQRLVPLMWAGIGCAAASLVPWLTLIWIENWLDWRIQERIYRVGGTFTIAAVIIAQCGLISLPRLQGRLARRVRFWTLAVSALFGMYVVTLFWWWDLLDRYVDDDLMLRGLGVMIILSLCGTVITPILWKVQAMRGAVVESIPVKARVQVVCPRCGSHQELAAGRGVCGGCGLRIAVTIEEPRCACGYLLHGPPGDRCPECGRAPGAEAVPAGTRSRRGVLAALAAGALPGIVLLAFIGGSWNMLRGGVAQPQPPGPIAPSPSAKTSDVNVMLTGYAWPSSESPRHAIELALMDSNQYLINAGPPFCDPGTRTATSQVPLGDGTLDDFLKAGRTERVRIVARVVEAMPTGVVAYRLGDFIFIDRGVPPVSSDQKLWTVVMVADPDANGPAGPDDPVFIATAGMNVNPARAEELPALLLEQNRHRATLGLPPLPDLTGVTHARPALAPTLSAQP